jgi:hypothetical protein
MRLELLVPTLQIAIGPVILISGVGLLLLSMTNRLGRTIDRIRALTREYRLAADEGRHLILAQLAVLTRRARTMQAAIALACLSILLDAILMIALFVGAIVQIRIAALTVATLFVACMGCLILSLLLLIADVNLGLRALRLEVEAATAS